MGAIRIEEGESREEGPCTCCGNLTRKVLGYVRVDDIPAATYFVIWTPGKLREHGAEFDLILGQWGDGTSRKDRYAVSLHYTVTERGPGFTIVDAADRPVAQSDLVGRTLARDEVVGSSIATQAFELIDAIWLSESRLAEFRNS